MSEMTKNFGEKMTKESILGKYMVSLFLPKGPLWSCCQKHEVFKRHVDEVLTDMV